MINIINPLLDFCGGSEQRSVHLANFLSYESDVKLWYSSKASIDNFAIGRGVQCIPIIEDEGQCPRVGTFVFVGFYDIPGDWFFSANPSRIIAIVNLNPLSPSFCRTVARLASHPVKTEFVFASRWIKDLIGVSGRIEYSLIDIGKFCPPSHSDLRRGFRVGRLSRDVQTKHSPKDPALYKELARRGFSCHIMGGTILSGRLAKKPIYANGITLYPAGYIDSVKFLHSLDCFLYRTHPNWVEPHGRVITEALACGLPIVAHRQGGYVDFIQHGVNGFLYDSNEQAVQYLEQIREDRQLHACLSQKARQTAESLFDTAVWAENRRYYADPIAC